MGNSNKKIRFRKKKKKIAYKRIFLLLITIFLLYVGIKSLITHIFDTKLKVYEVTEGSIFLDSKHEGIILRNETLKYVKNNGYVNSLVKEGGHIGVGQPIYTIDSTGKLSQFVKEQSLNENKFVEKDLVNIKKQISNYANNIDYDNLTSMYDIRDKINADLFDILSLKLANTKELIEQSGIKYEIVNSDILGNVSYVIDGFENLKENDIDISIFEEESKEKIKDKKTFISGEKIDKKEPFYKVVTSDIWYIIFPITKEEYDIYKDKRSLSVSLLDKNINVTLPYTSYSKDIVEQEENTKLEDAKLADKTNSEQVINEEDKKEQKKDEITDENTKKESKVNLKIKKLKEKFKKEEKQYFGKLTLDKYMLQYISDRFIDIEIAVKESDGLKIPNKAIVKKDFYIIPKEFMAKSQTNEPSGFIKEVYDENGTKGDFIKTPLFDENNQYYFIDGLSESGLNIGDYILKPKTNERYQIGPKESLEGVYNINEGYAVFKKIKKIEENDEYTIVEKNTKYGLRVFDHIILEPKDIKENDFVL